jgi:hypothetical protein
MGLGIASGVTGLFSFCCCGLGLIPLGLGIPAIALAQRDLGDINAGIVDESARSNTNLGRIFGIVGSSLGALALIVHLGIWLLSILARGH